MAHSKKSGSRGRREKPSQAVRPKRAYLSPAVQQALESGLAAAEQFPQFSTMAKRSTARMFVELIQRHGLAVCEAVLRHTLEIDNEKRKIAFFLPCFMALAWTHNMEEAKRLVRVLRYDDIQRMKIYHAMGIEADDEQKQDILVSMREWIERFHDPSELFDTRCQLYAVSRASTDFESALGALQVLLSDSHASKEWTRQNAESLIELAVTRQEIEFWRRAFDILSGLRPVNVQVVGELRLEKRIATMDRQELNLLHTAAIGTGYETYVTLRLPRARIMELDEGT